MVSENKGNPFVDFFFFVLQDVISVNLSQDISNKMLWVSSPLWTGEFIQSVTIYHKQYEMKVERYIEIFNLI